MSSYRFATHFVGIYLEMMLESVICFEVGDYGQCLEAEIHIVESVTGP